MDLALSVEVGSLKFVDYVKLLNDSLLFRTFLVEYNTTLADIATWTVLKSNYFIENLILKEARIGTQSSTRMLGDT